MFFTDSLGYFLTMSNGVNLKMLFTLLKYREKKQRFGEERMLALIIYV